MFKRIAIIAALCAVVFSSCQKGATDIIPTTSASNSNVNNTSGSVSTSAVTTNLDNALLLKLVNNIRATGCNCGTTVMPAVSALTWNDQLAAAALAHSKDMSATGIFSHNSSDDSTFDTRITATGYK